VKRQLLRSTAFIRAAKKLIKKNPQLSEDFQNALKLLSGDAFDPQLKTHKLKGKLEGSWACSVGYDLRIIFRFVQHEQSDAILLESIGTHEEVY